MFSPKFCILEDNVFCNFLTAQKLRGGEAIAPSPLPFCRDAMVAQQTYPGSPVGDGDEVLREVRIALNGVDRAQVSVVDARHLLSRRLSFAITQPDAATLRADHELLRLSTPYATQAYRLDS